MRKRLQFVDPHERLRAFVETVGSQTAAAQQLGVSGPYLNRMVHGRQPVTARVLARLGLRKVVVAG